MTLARLRRQSQPEAETRAATPTWSGGLTGYSVIDPAAIPPPGMGGNRNMAGVNVTPHHSLQVDAVFTSLRIISNAVIKLGDPMAYTQALDDSNWPYRKWVAEQPSFLTDTFGGGLQSEGRRQTIISMGLWGEAWWYVLEYTGGYPTAVEVLNPALLNIKRDKGKVIYKYGTGVDATELNRSKLIHIPHMSLPGSLRGLSSIEFAGVNYALALAALEYGARWFSQGASPSYILTTEQKLGQPEVERIADKFQVQHAGLTQSHLPLVLDSGLKAEKIQSSPDEAQFLQTLEYARSVIASYFGIPASLLGNALQRLSPEPAHTVQEESIRMAQYTLSGYLTPLEEVYSRALPKGTKAAFDQTLIQQPDAQSLGMLLMNLRNTNSVSINEVRTRYLNLPPVEGGDEVIAPLASNTAPEQTDNQDPAPATQDAPPAAGTP